MRHLYSHIEGLGRLDYNPSTFSLQVSKDNQVSVVPIGPDGLVELGLKLISLGHEISQTTVAAGSLNQ
jgi:hypothetical protein